MQITSPDTAPDRYDDGGNVRSGLAEKKRLLGNREGDAHSYRLMQSHAVTEYFAPRHRHDIDQIYMPLDGEFVYGKNLVLQPGYILYIPEGVYYGPQIRMPGLTHLNYLFGGASGRAYISPAERKVAIEAMKKKGKFGDGAFSWIDEHGQKHNQDASEAVWEQVMGRKLQYPRPRYRDVIVIDPAAFAWKPDPQIAGVETKLLAALTELDTRLIMIKLDHGASIQMGGRDAPDLLFVMKGAIQLAEHACAERTAIALEAGDPAVTITANETTELFCLKLSAL